MKTATDLGFARLKNPIMPASGCFGWGREYSRLFPLDVLGAAVTKAVTLHVRKGNPVPRLAETPCGMLNSIGLQNQGLNHALEQELPWLLEKQVPVIVNVAGSTLEEYVEVARGFEGTGATALELNLSCPNVDQGGIAFGTDEKALKEVVEQVAACCSLPLIVKLTPNVTDITGLARAAEAAGAAALTVANTLRGLAIDIPNRRPLLANTFGGLSGPAIKPVALALVWQASQAVSIPVIGCGGISSVEDVVEFLLAGASAVQAGTATFSQPLLLPGLVSGLEQWLEANDATVKQLVGAAHPGRQ